MYTQKEINKAIKLYERLGSIAAGPLKTPPQTTRCLFPKLNQIVSQHRRGSFWTVVIADAKEDDGRHGFKDVLHSSGVIETVPKNPSSQDIQRRLDSE